MSLNFGIDLTEQWAMISYYSDTMDEPETVSVVNGSENYQIPTFLAKKRNLGQWYYGDEAKRLAKSGDVICIEALLQRAINQEEIIIEDESYSAEKLLCMFLKKLISLAQKLRGSCEIGMVVLTVPELNKGNMNLFHTISEKLGLRKNQLKIVDHKEAFYFYALNQQADLWLHDVFLFEANGDQLTYYGLKRDLHTVPQLIVLDENRRIVLNGDKDAAFAETIIKAFENRIVSTAYLTGDGFDDNWMHESLNLLCRGRRAFMGKNLYVKGAAYAASVFEQKKEWPFVYIGENDMKFNLSMRLYHMDKLERYDLITAGTSCFEAKGACEIILGDEREIAFWKQLPDSRDAILESLELTDLPERPPRTTRLKISATPISDTKIEIEIVDLGFGELFRSSGKVWKYTMGLS